MDKKIFTVLPSKFLFILTYVFGSFCLITFAFSLDLDHALYFIVSFLGLSCFILTVCLSFFYFIFFKQLIFKKSPTDAKKRELSGRVLDSRLKGRGFEPHRRHCVVVLEQDKFILA